jgi:hypothetical protein
MKTPLLALLLCSAFAHGQQPPVYVNGAGDKWYSARELEQIASDYVNERKLPFSIEGTKRSVWVNTSGSNTIASVHFSPRMGSFFMVEIDRHGKVITNHVGVAGSHVGSPGYVDPGNTNLSRTNRLRRTPR